jgi:hypothetical protein
MTVYQKYQPIPRGESFDLEGVSYPLYKNAPGSAPLEKWKYAQ